MASHNKPNYCYNKLLKYVPLRSTGRATARLLARRYISKQESAMAESKKEDYSPLGIFISVCLLFLLGIQSLSFKEYYMDGNGEAAMFAGLLSLPGILLWVPGLILGYKILKKLNNKLVGYLTIILSSLEFFVLLWALVN